MPLVELDLLGGEFNHDNGKTACNLYRKRKKEMIGGITHGRS
jgi:hypothetical protein